MHPSIPASSPRLGVPLFLARGGTKPGIGATGVADHDGYRAGLGVVAVALGARTARGRCLRALGKAPHDLHIAPMMQVTHRHMRFLCRMLSSNLVLWTEMIKDTSLTYNADNPDFLRKMLDLSTDQEHPATWFKEAGGYDEINLNCGCPSEAAVRTRCGHGVWAAFGV
ncbi:tRNA-dihydrouridine synthase A [Symbiodinium microadriaticum]|uniref:tRNA-dihydrouridine synthase A n=1 Tax=Symbiodinium microadriaticum TaxID=2951 RepID=A0A1Q9D9L1_SYMMI|nr:tRNA-dihydrouridine synthase A [Symbiodinium microadriaticum]